MGYKKRLQVLIAASVFIGLSVTSLGNIFISCRKNNEWSTSVPNGIAAVVSTICAAICMDIWRLNPANSHTLVTLLIQYRDLLILRLIQPLIRFLKWKRTRNPRKVNEASLLYILRRSQNSEYGKKYKFSEIRCQEDFIEMHPITTPEDYRNYTERIAAGEENVLYTGKTVGLVATSGTTGKAKVYALTEEHRTQMRRQVGPVFFETILPLMNLQRNLTFRIHTPLTKSKGGLPVGFVSQLVLQFPVYNLVPDALVALHSEDASFYAQGLFALAERELRFIYGFSADLMYSFWKFLGERWGDLCEDIKNGTIDASHVAMPPEVRERLSAPLKPDPARAADLTAAMANGGYVGLARRCWPDFEFLIIGKSAAFKMCSELLMEKQFAGIKVIGAGHGASEGLTGLNMETEKPHVGEVLTMVPYSSFMEFIPLEKVEEENPCTVFMEKLELGKMYEVVHTSLNGLYRCRYGDIIKIVGFNNKTPKYEFVFKLGQRLNIAYERTPDKILYEAINECQHFLPSGISLENYTSTESIALEKITGQQGKGHYVLFIELNTDVDIDCNIMAKEMDSALMRIYQPYKRFKDIDSIGPLTVVQVERGTFEQLKAHVWNRPHTQFKMPRVQRGESALRFLVSRHVPKCGSRLSKN